MDLPDIETVAAKVHEAWMNSKSAQGVKSRKSETGEELMTPYGQLSEEAKDLDRAMVRAVYAAIHAAQEETRK
jgi:RyR domain